MFGDLFVEGLNGALVYLIEDYISTFGNIIVWILSTAKNVLDLPIIKSGILYVQGLAITLLAINVANESIQTYILYTRGDPDSNPTGLLVKTGQAVAIIATVPWIVKWMYLLGTTIAIDVSNLSIAGQTSTNLLDVFQDYRNAGAFILISILVGLIILLLVFLQTFKRTAELGMLAVLGGLMSVNLVSANKGMFNMWFKELIVICVSQALQIFMINVSFYILSGVMNFSIAILNTLSFVVWLWVAFKSPKWLKQFVYSSGIGSGATGAAKSVGTMVIMRKIITKGA